MKHSAHPRPADRLGRGGRTPPARRSLRPGRAHSAFARAQASLELTVAVLGALLLLFGGLRISLWFVKRLATRQQHYEATRVQAGDSSGYVAWVEPNEPLDLFKND